MSVILRGLGLDVDSTSSIVAFGLTVNPKTPEEAMDAIQKAGIENLFVIDFDGRRPLTKPEYRRYRRLVAMMRMGSVQFKQKRGGFEIFIERLPSFRKAA